MMVKMGREEVRGGDRDREHHLPERRRGKREKGRPSTIVKQFEVYEPSQTNSNTKIYEIVKAIWPSNS